MAFVLGAFVVAAEVADVVCDTGAKVCASIENAYGDVKDKISKTLRRSKRIAAQKKSKINKSKINK